MTEASWLRLMPRTQREALREYFRLVLGEGAGYLHVARGRSRLPSDQKDWRERSFRFPEEAEQALDFIEASDSQGYDVYICPYLGTTVARAKGGTVSRRIVHADVDRDLDLDAVVDLGGFVVWSGTPGRGHVYVPLSRTVTVQEHTQLCRGLIDRLGGDPSKQSDNDLLRPPGTHNYKVDGSPLPVVLGDDFPVGVRDPGELAAELDVDLATLDLTHRNHRGGGTDDYQGDSYVSVPAALNRLSERFADMVTSGDSTNYESRSEARMGVTIHAVRRGLSLQDFASIALNPAHGMSAWYRGRGRPLLKREWGKAVETANAPGPSVREKLQTLARAALTVPFPQQSGASTYVVLQGIIARARAINRMDIDISVRDAAIYGNVSADTAAKAIKRLITLGWLVKLRDGHAARRVAPRYRLTIPDPDRPHDSGGAEPRDLPTGDYWVRVGSSALQIFHQLMHRAMSVEEIVAATGRSRDTVRRHLLLLRDDGLLTEQDGTWRVSRDRTEELAAEYGWTGARQKRTETYARERQAWEYTTQGDSWITDKKSEPKCGAVPPSAP